MIRVITAYLYKYYWEQRYYLPNYLFELLGHLLFFLGLFLLFFQGDPVRFLQGLMGFLLWMASLSIMYESAILVWEDSLLGTLEHLYMSPHPFWGILLGRTVANMAIHTGLYAVFLAGALTVYRITGHPLTFPAVPWPWVGLAAVGMFFACWGMGLALFGVALVIKRAGSVTGFLYWVLFFTSGALFSVSDTSGWLLRLARLTPIGPAGLMMATAVQGGHPERLVGLLGVNAALYVLLGFGVMHWGLERARRTGKMARY